MVENKGFRSGSILHILNTIYSAGHRDLLVGRHLLTGSRRVTVPIGPTWSTTHNVPIFLQDVTSSVVHTGWTFPSDQHHTQHRTLWKRCVLMHERAVWLDQLPCKLHMHQACAPVNKKGRFLLTDKLSLAIRRDLRVPPSSLRSISRRARKIQNWLSLQWTIRIARWFHCIARLTELGHSVTLPCRPHNRWKATEISMIHLIRIILSRLLYRSKRSLSSTYFRITKW